MKTWETETRENEKNTLFKVMLDCSRELVGFLPYANDGAGCTLSMMQFKMNGVAEKLIDAVQASRERVQNKVERERGDN